MKQKVLILGSAGLIGHQVYNHLAGSTDYDLFNLSCTRNLNDETILCDVRDESQVIGIFKAIKPDVVVNCIGILIKGANENPQNAIFLNSYFPHLLKNLCNAQNSKLIHISTDCVFSGKKSQPYQESDLKDGIDTYAKSKGLGEIIDQKHLTLRTSVIGPELKNDGEELFHWFMAQTGKVLGYTRAIWSGVTTLVLAKGVLWGIENDISGLYHITNNQKIDKYQLLCLFKKYMKKQIVIEKSDEVNINKSFIDTRKEISFKIPSFEQMIKEMSDFMRENNELYSHYSLRN